MIKTIIFDVGGVLVPENGKIIEKRVADFIGITVTELRESSQDLRDKTISGEMSLLDMYTKVLKNLKKGIKPEYVLQKHLDEYEKTSTSVDHRVLDLIHSLKERFAVVCLTNTEMEICEYNISTGLFEIFDKGFLSTEMGMKKPDRMIFQAVLDEVDCKPDECIFIDDNPDYIEAAKLLGIHTILYKKFEQLENELKNIIFSE